MTTSSNQPPNYSPPGYPPQGSAPPATQETKPHRRVVSTGQILAGLLLVVVVVFVVENSRSVRIRLIVPEIEAPLYVAILISAVLGALIAALLRYRRHHRASSN